jgi:hypothetical protein
MTGYAGAPEAASGGSADLARAALDRAGRFGARNHPARKRSSEIGPGPENSIQMSTTISVNA